MTAQQSASEWSGRGRPAASLDFLALGCVGYAGSALENRSALIPRLRQPSLGINRSALIPRLRQPSLGMTQSLLKRKFLVTQLGHRRRDGGNTTSYMAAALTLTLSLDRERDRKMDTQAESKNSQTRYRTITSSGRERPWSDCRSCSALRCG